MKTIATEIQRRKAAYIPLFILHVVFLIICVVNFHPGKTFIGWDSINAELNSLLNVQRALFSGWQEYYGVGLLGGHGFAALLPYSLIGLIFQFILPQWAIRTTISLLLVYVGIVGMYALIVHLLKKMFINSIHFANFLIEWVGLFGSLVYLFNQGTVEQLFTQTEAFTFHFAALPWLFLATILILKKVNRKRVLLFIAVNFLFSTQAFVPPIFVGYFLSLVIFLVLQYYSSHFDKKTLKGSILVVILTVIVNSYWMFPFVINQITNRGVFLDSYNNLIQTQEFIQKNNKFGDLKNVALLKGFFWESKMFDNFILLPWRSHFQNQIIPFIGYGIFLISLIGVGFTILNHRKSFGLGFVGVFLLYFSNLATNIFPFSNLIHLLQKFSSTYYQAFRNPFTKFSIGTGFCYSIFFSISIFVILYFIYRHKKQIISISTVYALLFGLLLYFGFPMLQGNLFYDKLFLKIPSAYSKTIAFFNNQADGRIADLPQDCPEGWYQYNWRYVGSGFMWYGVKQPMLSRTFDVWHNANENYYWEVVQALREKNFDRFYAIMQKYDVRWILYDGNLKHCQNQKIFLKNDELLHFLNNSPLFTLKHVSNDSVVEPVFVYEVSKSNKSYVAVTNNLMNVLPAYAFTDLDKALDLTSYYQSSVKDIPDLVFPFRSFFNKRSPVEADFEIVESDDSFTVRSRFDLPQENRLSIRIPPYKDLEEIIPVQLSVQAVGANRYGVYLRLLFPSININGHTVYHNDFQPLLIGTLPSQTVLSTKVIVNENVFDLSLDKQIDTHFYLKNNNSIVFLDQNNSPIINWQSNENLFVQRSINASFESQINLNVKNIVDVSFPKRTDNGMLGFIYDHDLIKNLLAPCDVSSDSIQNWNEVGSQNGREYLKLISQNSMQCLNLDFTGSQISLGYMMRVGSRNNQGPPLRINLMSSKGINYLKTDVHKKQTFNTTSFIVPPSNQNEIGYKALIENSSLDNNTTNNDVSHISFSYMPFHFIKSIELDNLIVDPSYVSTQNMKVKHSDVANYQIELQTEDEKLANNKLILFQSFHPGWKAYKVADFELINRSFPFFYGKELQEHVLINNWANGWELAPGKHNIVVVFWPQYLEFIGFGLLVLCIICILFIPKKTI